MAGANKIGIKQAPLDKQFRTRCVVRDIQLKYTSAGKPYLELELGDFSGRLKARLWEQFEKWQKHLARGVLVDITCTPYLYQNRRELKIHSLSIVTNPQPGDFLELLPRYPGDMKTLIATFEKQLQSIQHAVWQRLIDHAFKNDAFRQRYFQVPAGKLWHHVYLGGLLHHVVSMLQLADAMEAIYPELDFALLKTGIVFHDVGKLWCFDFSRGFIDYNNEGRLIGHVVLGSTFITRLMGEVEEFPKEYRAALMHLIISHPGHQTEGAPVLPQTREAIALWLINDIDKKLNAVHRILSNDVNPREGWSKFSPLLERFLFQGFSLKDAPEKQSHSADGA